MSLIPNVCKCGRACRKSTAMCARDKPTPTTDPARVNNMNRFLASAPAGCIVEVGVYRGGSLAGLASANPTRQCYGYDTFEGLPKPSDKDNEAKEGMFCADYAAVCESFVGYNNVQLFKCVYPEGAASRPDNVALVHIDVDIYSSTINACRHLAPSMVKGGRIYCDDAGVLACQGATLAFIEFAVGIGRLIEFDRGGHWYIQF